jgi:hypothetical protein
VLVTGHVDNDRGRQDQDVVLALGNVHAVGVSVLGSVSH